MVLIWFRKFTIFFSPNNYYWSILLMIWNNTCNNLITLTISRWYPLCFALGFLTTYLWWVVKTLFTDIIFNPQHTGGRAKLPKKSKSNPLEQVGRSKRMDWINTGRALLLMFYRRRCVLIKVEEEFNNKFNHSSKTYFASWLRCFHSWEFPQDTHISISTSLK